MINQNQNDNSSGDINGCCGGRNNTWDNAGRSCGNEEAISPAEMVFGTYYLLEKVVKNRSSNEELFATEDPNKK